VAAAAALPGQAASASSVKAAVAATGQALLFLEHPHITAAAGAVAVKVRQPPAVVARQTAVQEAVVLAAQMVAPELLEPRILAVVEVAAEVLLQMLAAALVL
jgi:hypothetical protein